MSTPGRSEGGGLPSVVVQTPLQFAPNSAGSPALKPDVGAVSSRSDSFTPTDIGDYEIIRKLGKGRYSTVHLARHKVTGVEVACKVVQKKGVDAQLMLLLRREVSALTLLHHPHIVELFQVIESERELFLIMEYASGGELYDYMVAHGKMNEKDARVRFRQLCQAVHYCHTMGIVHRDLKAENVLLDAEANAIISDFGLSNTFRPGELLKTFCGSPAYAPPEVLVGRPYTGPEVDVWSLGVVLYVLISGVLPFHTRQDVLAGRFTVPPGVSQSCGRMFKSIFRPEPRQRPTILEILSSVWMTDEDNRRQVTFAADGSPIHDPPSAVEEVDYEVVHLMKFKYGYDENEIIDSITPTLMYNSVSAAYLILRNRKRKRKKLHHQDLYDLSLRSRIASQSQPTDFSTSASLPTEETFDPSAPAIVARSPISPRGLSKTYTEGNAGGVKALSKESPPQGAQRGEQRRDDRDAAKKDGVSGSKTRETQSPPFKYGVNSDKDTFILAANDVMQRRKMSAFHEKTSPDMAGLPPPSPGSRERSRSENNARKEKTVPQRSTSVLAVPHKDEELSGGRNNISGTRLTPLNGETSNLRRAVSAKSLSKSPGTPTGPTPSPSQPRTVRFSLSVKTTSSKSPQALVVLIVNALRELHIGYGKEGDFIFHCRQAGVEFEIEVIRVPLLPLHAIRFKRLDGPVEAYKGLCQDLLGVLDQHL
eukprot:comp12074_c0_seq1/m.6805 comp12074_c0_seq1/g.6805  ORF comp12074_c0_seq1/g.6805 comp12074_c0_seq1/m.6805 type:complete len:706 (-) comp12074_c0_seq1:428-2545(-)